MTQEKESIGFSTPSKKLNDALSKILENLSKQKADWQSVSQELTAALITAEKTLGENRVNPNAVIAIMTIIHIAKLGIEVAEIHERLAKLEKAVKELK